MPKYLLLILILTIILLTASITLLKNTNWLKAASKKEIDTAVNQAKLLYSIKKGEDISTGPCLSDALMPNWVLDIAHSPRQSIDDLPENQCPSYREGRSKHFVELDIDGNLIRAE